MLRYGIIGTSDITKQFIASAQTTGLWELTAVYSRTEEKGTSFGKDYGVESIFTDLDAFAQSNLFDAVYVASPNALHYEHCKILLENKKHVICEKAFTSYLWQAEELFQMAEDSGVVLMEAMMFMHQPNREILDKAVADLGDITMAFFDNSQRSSKYDAYLQGNLPNIFNPNLHAGGLMDMGVYSLYPALYFFGEPEEFSMEALMLRGGADGLGNMTLKYENQVVNVRYSKIAQGATGSDIQGAHGVLKIDNILHLGDITFINNQGQATLLAKRTPKIEIMAKEAKDFYEFITGKRSEDPFYRECKAMTLRVCKYLEIARKEIGLFF